MSTMPRQAVTRSPDFADESALLARLRAGDGQAFEYLVRTYSGQMMAAAKRLLRSDDDAADAVQDAFISAFKALDRFEGTSKLSTWLHRIAINAALMKLRSRRRREEVSIDSLMPTFLDDGHRRDTVPAWAKPSDELLQREETRRMVRDKIDQLPDDHRTVLILRDIEMLDTAATAEVLGILPGAVKTRLHRARMALRKLLENELR